MGLYFAINVVNVNQHLGAVHTKCWSKYAFSSFFALKAEKGSKSKKFDAKFSKKKQVLTRILVQTPKCWSRVIIFANNVYESLLTAKNSIFYHIFMWALHEPLVRKMKKVLFWSISSIFHCFWPCEHMRWSKYTTVHRNLAVPGITNLNHQKLLKWSFWKHDCFKDMGRLEVKSGSKYWLI